ncbi:LysR family transcriptional regulator [Fusobacterium sp. PH5-44]|uniref:LysR family transcriptional regulator n=1 Tax=unclassified Fusobacterium TaxID=2648384 RepID=UPI003D225BAE
MFIININLKLLKYFIEISNCKSFTGASKSLYLCQSALSKAIKTFESELGLTLIDRTYKNFQLTPEGQLLYENGTIALKVIDEQLKKLHDSISSEKGRIKVGVPPVISTIYFTSTIQEFRNQYPNIHLDVIEAGANTVKNKVESGEIDIGVVILPFCSNDFYVTPVFHSDNVAIVHKKHHLAKQNEINLIQLREEPLIILNETYMLHDKIKEICNFVGFEPNIICKSSQWDFIAEMVALNQGTSILPRPILSKFHSKNIKILTIKEPEFPWEIALIIRKDKYVSKAMKLFVDFVKNIK